MSEILLFCTVSVQLINLLVNTCMVYRYLALNFGSIHTWVQTRDVPPPAHFICRYNGVGILPYSHLREYTRVVSVITTPRNYA